jgi:hypothetical protein
MFNDGNFLPNQWLSCHAPSVAEIPILGRSWSKIRIETTDC